MISEITIAPVGGSTGKKDASTEIHTLEAALEELRILKNRGEVRFPATIWCKGGTYPVTRPILITPEDSMPVTFKAVPGEEPVFDGGFHLKHWKKTKLNGKNVLCASVPECVIHDGAVHQFHVNGKRKKRAAWPKLPEVLTPAKPGVEFKNILFNTSDRFYVKKGDFNPGWYNPQGIEAQLYQLWTESHLPVESFDPETGLVKFRYFIRCEVNVASTRYTWQNVRSSWFGIDGLRHIFRPFVNYTYIGKPTESREHLYYFDDIDRIDKQNFIRIGMENRLQTRERDRLVNLIAMENYLDVHLEKEDGFGYMGNFGTVLELYLMRNLWLTSQLLVDTGDSPTVVAAGDDDDNGLKWLNRWNISLTYEPIEDVKFRLGYDYINAYRARSAYSMGSTLTQIDAGSYFNNYNTTRSEDLTIGVSAPLTPDRRTFGAFVFSYDFVRGHTSDIGFSLSRQFHCVELIAYLGFEYETSRHKSNVWDTNFSVQARLTGLEGPINQKQNETLASANRQLFLGGGATDR